MLITGWSSVVRKRRTREHVIADLSVNHFEYQALLCGYSIERISKDYGYDLILITYNEKGEPDSGYVLIQLKATDSLRRLRDKNAITCRVDQADVARWIVEPTPVILVVYDAQARMAYWLYIQAYFEKHPPTFSATRSGKITVHLPEVNALDVSAIQTFRMYRDDVINQFSEVIVHHE